MPDSKPSRTRVLDLAAYAGPAAALACSIPILFVALSPFRFGFWRGAEPVVVAFHASAALCSVALLLVWLRDGERFLRAILHPYVLLPAALALWSVLVAPLAKFPLLSVLGSPQSGEGGLWYANLATFVACGLLAAERRGAWRFLVVGGVLVVLAVAAVEAVALARDTIIFFLVRDYVAFFALPLVFLSLSHTGGKWRWLRLAAMVAALAVLAVSGNLAAWLLFLLAAVMVGGGLLAEKYGVARGLLRARAGALAVVTFFAVVPLFLVTSGDLLEGVESLRSRHLGLALMEQAQGLDARSLLVGNGWGHTQEAMIVHLNAANQVLWDLSWDFTWSDWFHSHNWMIESLYSAGIPGLVLSLAFFLALPAFCEPRMRVYATVFAACFAALSTVWFQLSFTVPFVALAMAALAGRTTGVSPRIWEPARRLLPLAVAMIFAAQSFAAAVLLTFGLRVSTVRAAYIDPPDGIVEQHYPKDFRGAEYAFAMSVRHHIEDLNQRNLKADDPARDKQRMVIDWLFKDLEERIEDSRSPFLVLAGVSAISDIMFNPTLEWLRPDYEGKTAQWGRWVEKFLRLAPGRTDVAIPYFSWLLGERQTAKLVRITGGILTRNPEDAAGLFYRGAALIVGGRPEDRSLALDYLRKGLDRGIERYMPVDSAFKEMINRSM